MICRPPPPLKAKRLFEADAAEIADLFARCSDYFCLQDGEMPTPSDAQNLFADVPPPKTPSDQTVMGWKGTTGAIDALAAILRDYPDPGIWYLGLLIVDPALRGRGYGRSIYAAVERRAEARGAKEIRLAVLEANEAAECFWRSLGFERFRQVGPHAFKTKLHRRVEFRRLLEEAPAVRPQRP